VKEKKKEDRFLDLYQGETKNGSYLYLWTDCEFLFFCIDHVTISVPLADIFDLAQALNFASEKVKTEKILKEVK
jgi:hypothetical protein